MTTPAWREGFRRIALVLEGASLAWVALWIFVGLVFGFGFTKEDSLIATLLFISLPPLLGFATAWVLRGFLDAERGR